MFNYECRLCKHETREIDISAKKIAVGVVVKLKCPNCETVDSHFVPESKDNDNWKEDIINRIRKDRGL